MLPEARAVRAALLGEGGIAPALNPGTVIVDMSSSYPPATRETGAMLADKGLILLDAPVSGGVKRAVEGTLAIMLGDDDRAQPKGPRPCSRPWARSPAPGRSAWAMRSSA